jgi:hypothetical protein
VLPHRGTRIQSLQLYIPVGSIEALATDHIDQKETSLALPLRHLHLRDDGRHYYGCNAVTISAVATWYATLTSLTLHTRALDGDHFRVLARCTHIRHLSCSLEPQFRYDDTAVNINRDLYLIAKDAATGMVNTFPLLQSLTIVHSYTVAAEMNRMITAVIKLAPTLTSLQFKRTCVWDKGIDHSRHISATNLVQLATHCRRLHSFYLPSLPSWQQQQQQSSDHDDVTNSDSDERQRALVAFDDFGCRVIET